MGRKPLEEGERKENFTIRIKKKYIDQIKQFENYSIIVENLISIFLKNNLKK